MLLLYTRSSAVFGSTSCQVPSASVYGCVLVTTSAERQTLGRPRTRGTNSWLDDTHKNFGPDCLNCTKFGQLIFKKIINCCHQMPDFRAKMHQIRFRLGLRPRPRYRRAYSALPDALAGFKGPTSNTKEGKGREERGREERKVEGREREGRGGKGRREREGMGYNLSFCLRTPQT